MTRCKGALGTLLLALGTAVWPRGPATAQATARERVIESVVKVLHDLTEGAKLLLKPVARDGHRP